MARIFGVDGATNAFFVAFKIPNLLQRLFSEGAFAHAFVPVMADYNDQGSKAALKLFTDKIAGTLALILMPMTVRGIIAAPVLILLLAFGFLWQGTQHDLIALMLQITFPYCYLLAWSLLPAAF